MTNKKELGDDLCKYCPLEKKGVYVVAGGPFAGCEGSRCDEAYENFISQNSKSMKDFKLLPIDLFGELLQCLYDSEVNFCIEWTWDGGFDWGFGLEKSASTIALAKRIDHTNLEEVGGLILHEYMTKFDGLDSEDKPNKMQHFLEKVLQLEPNISEKEYGDLMKVLYAKKRKNSRN